MVRGSFSASFPVIAVIISPTFTRRYPDNNKKDQAGALGWKHTSVDQDRRLKKKKKKERWRDGSFCGSFPSIPRRTSGAGSLLLCDRSLLLILIWSLRKLMGCLWGDFEVCESIEEVVVAQERLCLLYWSWIGDSSLLVLNMRVGHACDVDDHIWTE